MKIVTFIWQKIPERIRHFLVGGPECVFESALSPSALLERFSSTLGDGFLFPTGYPSGFAGRVNNDALFIRWVSEWTHNGFELVFRGRVIPTAAGCKVVGNFAGRRVAQMFLGIVCGALLLMAVIFVWTIMVTLGAWAVLWLIEWVLSMSDEMTPRIRDYITRTCEAVPPAR